MKSPMGICMMRLCSHMMSLELLLECSRMNICLSGGECNDQTDNFELYHSVRQFKILSSFI